MFRFTRSHLFIFGIWYIIPIPKGKFVVTSKWFLKIKHGSDGNIEKYKERFVARGFSQKEGEDYDDIFSPVFRYTTIRSIVSLDGCRDHLPSWHITRRSIY